MSLLLNRILLFLIITSCLSTHGKTSLILPNQIINICAEDTGWAPYSSLSKNKLNDEVVLSGFNRDILEEIFKKNNIKYNLMIKPWQRCLKEGISGDVHIVLDAASSEQRRRDYLLSIPIYRMTPAYFFHRNKEFKKLSAKDILKNSSICGQSGYTYTHFGVPNDRVKKLSKSLIRIFDLVSAERCTIGLTRLEVLKRELHNFKEYSNISYSKIYGVNKEEFFWLINKNFIFSKQLKDLIDSEYRALEKRGVINKLSLKYNI